MPLFNIIAHRDHSILSQGVDHMQANSIALVVMPNLILPDPVEGREITLGQQEIDGCRIIAPGTLTIAEVEVVNYPWAPVSLPVITPLGMRQ